MVADAVDAKQLNALIDRIAAADGAAIASKQRVGDAEQRQLNAEAEARKLGCRILPWQEACRETQRKTKALEEEAAGLAQESAKRRADLAAQFDKAIDDIRSKMGTEEGEVTRLEADNEALRAKLAGFEAQFEATSKHWAAEARAVELEGRLAHARVAEAEARLQQHHAALGAFGEQLGLSAERVSEQRAQKAAYDERLLELREAVGKSEDVFGSYQARCAELDGRAGALEAEAEAMRAKAAGAGGKRASLEAKLAELERATAQATAEREELARACRELQARRAQRRAGAPAAAPAGAPAARGAAGAEVGALAQAAAPAGDGAAEAVVHQDVDLTTFPYVD